MKCHGHGTRECYSIAQIGNYCRACHDKNILAEKDELIKQLKAENKRLKEFDADCDGMAMKIRQLKSKNKELKKELEELKNYPLGRSLDIPDQDNSYKEKKEIRVDGKAYCPSCNGWHPTAVMCEPKQKQAIEMKKIIRQDKKRTQ